MIGLVGLDYQRATSEQRGRLTYSSEELTRALQALAATPALDEVAILSTCNRTEFYVAGPDWAAAASAVEHFILAEARRAAAEEVGAVVRVTTQPAEAGTAALQRASVAGAVDLLDALYQREGVPAMRHLLRVAAGLESMVVGEAQILGQVKDALTAAEAAGTIGDELRTLFYAAIKTGKRARTETELGRADVSVASVALAVARDTLGTLRGRRALVIGAGRTSRLCAHLLRDEGVGRIVLANRTPSLAADLAAEVGGEVIALEGVAAHLAEVDVLISATAAPYAVLRTDAIAAAGVGERVDPLLILDLAVPPDVEPTAGALPGVILRSLDTLRAHMSTPADGNEQRQETLGQVEQVVEAGLHEHLRARTLRLAVPSIAALRQHVDRSEQAEVARALAELAHLSERDRRVVERFGQRLVDKMFHHLVSRIRSLAEYDEVPPEVTMRVLTRLFADPDASAAARERALESSAPETSGPTDDRPSRS